MPQSEHLIEMCLDPVRSTMANSVNQTFETGFVNRLATKENACYTAHANASALVG